MAVALPAAFAWNFARSVSARTPRRVSSEAVRLPLSAYETALPETPRRLAISVMVVTNALPFHLLMAGSHQASVHAMGKDCERAASIVFTCRSVSIECSEQVIPCQSPPIVTSTNRCTVSPMHSQVACISVIKLLILERQGCPVGRRDDYPAGITRDSPP